MKFVAESLAFRGLGFALIWWILTNGAAPSWWIGIPAVLLAAMVSTVLVPPVHLNWYGCLRFVPFFLGRSLMGGLDVAWRAYHPRLPINPELVEYPLRLPPGLPSVFMANTVSILPGTLSAQLDTGVLKVHVLDARRGLVAELEQVERRVAQMFSFPDGRHRR